MNTTMQIISGEYRPLSSIVSEEVRSLMGRRNVSQGTLAEIMGLNQTAVSARLRGKTPWKVDEVGHLAGFFGVPAASFFRAGGTNPVIAFPPKLPGLDSNQEPSDPRVEIAPIITLRPTQPAKVAA